MSDSQSGLSEEMRNALAADLALFEQHGMTLKRAARGRAVIHAGTTENMVNARGLVHGGMAYVIADTACAYALRSVGTSGVTQNAGFTYLSGATAGMKLEATAEIVKAGRRVASLRAEVRAGDTLIAHGIFNFVLARD